MPKNFNEIIATIKDSHVKVFYGKRSKNPELVELLAELIDAAFFYAEKLDSLCAREEVPDYFPKHLKTYYEKNSGTMLTPLLEEYFLEVLNELPPMCTDKATWLEFTERKLSWLSICLELDKKEGNDDGVFIYLEHADMPKYFIIYNEVHWKEIVATSKDEMKPATKKRQRSNSSKLFKDLKNKVERGVERTKTLLSPRAQRESTEVSRFPQKKSFSIERVAEEVKPVPLAERGISESWDNITTRIKAKDQAGPVLGPHTMFVRRRVISKCDDSPTDTCLKENALRNSQEILIAG